MAFSGYYPGGNYPRTLGYVAKGRIMPRSVHALLEQSLSSHALSSPSSLAAWLLPRDFSLGSIPTAIVQHVHSGPFAAICVRQVKPSREARSDQPQAYFSRLIEAAQNFARRGTARLRQGRVHFKVL